MRDIWSFLLQTLTASGAAVLLLAVKAMFRDKLSPRWQFEVWGILAIVLLIPAGFFGRYVLLNWPFYVELLRSVLTGEYGALARVTAPVPLPPRTAPRTVTDWLFVLYTAGAVFFLARLLISYVRLRRALKRGRPVEDGRVLAAAEKYGLSVCSAVEVEGLPSAFICGIFKPVLALPAGAETDGKVLLHELLHLKHHDAAWGLVIGLFRCLHWCNPLLWYCADQAGNDLESLCDQRVLERLEGEDRRDYGRILLEMANERYARAPGTSSMANGGKNIRRRIEAIARFKRYPAGMGLVSVCILLALAVPLVIGVKAAAAPDYLSQTAQIVYSRTVPCTTYAGAFDTYAKAVLTGRTAYRAMCAPLAEQNELAEKRWPELDWCWPAISWKDIADRSAGYHIYNLNQVGEDAYEGILVLELTQAPTGMESESNYLWMAFRTLRAEKEQGRWVITPLEEFRAVQAYGLMSSPSSCDQLPAWEYEDQAGDFTLRMRWQTSCHVDSYEQTSSLFGTFSTFSTIPQPNGEFVSWYYQHLSASYTGSPADKDKYQNIGAACKPMWEECERPVLESLPSPVGPDGKVMEWSSGSNDGSELSQHNLGLDWDNQIFLSGGGSSRDGLIDRPACYAADLYLNGEKTAELTLRPVKGGLDLG